MNLILMKFGYPPAVIRREEREDYFLFLEEADKGMLTPLIDLVAKELKKSLLIMIEFLDGNSKYECPKGKGPPLSLN